MWMKNSQKDRNYPTNKLVRHFFSSHEVSFKDRMSPGDNWL
jgi:hypothetical protein